MLKRGGKHSDTVRAAGREMKAAAPSALNGAVGGLALALQFLTVLPVRTPQQPRPAGERGQTDQAADQADPAPNMATALPWFPLIGALIGAALALLDWALRSSLSPGVRSALVLVVMAGLTGMLHLDGFIDCCDGLLGVRSAERRLAILRDSRVGAYGVIGGGLLLLLRFAALSALAQPETRALALIAAPLLGRWSMVYAIERFPYARSSGVGAPFRSSGARLAWATALAYPLLVLVCALLGATGGAMPLLQTLALAITLGAAAFVVTLGATAWMSGRLDGGLTGDTYGALNECVEVATLVLVPLIVVVIPHLSHI